jgi:leader peptidase (prepilin peptidase) / N-methyltransferase
MSALTPLMAALFGLLAGVAVDARVARAAAAEANPEAPLDRHLRGARWRRIVVPVISAAGCLAAALRWGHDPVLVPLLFFLPLLAGLAVVDLHTRRLPNALTGPALVGGLLLVVGFGLVQDRPAAVVTAIVTGVLLFGVLLLLSLIRPAGMGMGDVKVAGLIGLFLGLIGLGPALLAVSLSAVLAWIAGVTLIGTGRIRRGTALPFGPWLAVGALIAVLAGPELVRAYLHAVS